MAEDEDLKAFIHIQYEKLFSDWTTTFKFPSYWNGIYRDDDDILIYVGKNIFKSNQLHVQFCSEKYPIDGKFDGVGFMNLSNNLCRASIDNGLNLMKNGSYPYGNGKCIAKKFLALDQHITKETQRPELL